MDHVRTFLVTALARGGAGQGGAAATFAVPSQETVSAGRKVQGKQRRREGEQAGQQVLNATTITALLYWTAIV